MSMMFADIPDLISDLGCIQPLVVILGPTAVGKTQVAIQLAIHLHSEIISADSRLLYTGMDIGTAKPTLAEQNLIPHHLIDVTSPDQIWSLAQYQTAAKEAIRAVHQRSHLPLLVGGTGQYVHAITQGWQIPPAPPDPFIRKALENWATQIGYMALHERLAHLDPEAAIAIDPSNARRTIRALEVIFSTGHPFSEQRRHITPPFTILKLGITRPRHELYQRIDERIDAMLQSGFVNEVQHLLDLGYSPELPTLSAIGYGELISYLQKECSLEEAISSMKRRTRVFVRRQANWFKPNDPSIQWFTVDLNTTERIERTIHQWLREIQNSMVTHL